MNWKAFKKGFFSMLGRDPDELPPEPVRRHEKPSVSQFHSDSEKSVDYRTSAREEMRIVLDHREIEDAIIAYLTQRGFSPLRSEVNWEDYDGEDLVVSVDIETPLEKIRTPKVE